MLVTEEHSLQYNSYLILRVRKILYFKKNFFRIFTFEDQKKTSTSKNELKEVDQKQQKTLDMESMHNKCI